MVLRARWIFGGAGETEGEQEAMAVEDKFSDEEEVEGAGAGTALLLPGPETLILARPGDNVDDVEGEEGNGEEESDGRDLVA